VLALYPEDEIFQAAFRSDVALYKSARSELGISNLSNTTFHALDNTYLDTLNINDLASVLGIGAVELKRALDASQGAFPAETFPLRQGGSIQRDAFEAIIADIMACLSVGRQNVCGCVSACWKDLRAEIEHQRKTPDEMWLLFVVGMVSKGV